MAHEPVPLVCSCARGRPTLTFFHTVVNIVSGLRPTVALAWGLLAAAQAAAQTYPVRIETSVRTTMRDGVALVSDIYRPDADGRFPVLLQRTPYDRLREFKEGHDLARHGYVVIIQDVRGRFDSEGEFYPFRHESRDGFDTVEWAASLPYADGQVGMFGGSYVGATQMLAAMAGPPHLGAIFPYVTASEYYEGWTYQSGALMQWFTSTWSSGLSTDTLRRFADANRPFHDWMRRPLLSYPTVQLPAPPDLVPYFRDWIAHERDDDYWRPWKISDHYGAMTVKALHAGGWHDIFLKGSIQNYIGMRRSASTPVARDGQRLLVGPWAHASTSPEGKIGDVVFGPEAVIDMTATTKAWFDHSLKGVPNEYATRAPVRIFVMGENAWRDEADFPLARTRYDRYFLDCDRVAAGATPGRLLQTRPPRQRAPQAYEYDPENPAPTLGGRLCCSDKIPPGPADQRSIESRPDVLVFSTPPLERPVEVTGYVTLELYAATSATDTDFTATLADVDPSGYARFLTDGIVRARYRSSTRDAEPVVPGQVYKFTIDLWATSNLFKAGHRIRLYVSSSNFPRFDRNPNTGESIVTASRWVKARQTIYHDRERPSALILPVIPR
jgi:putative CocE/NonD family hydrolase